MLNKKEIKVKKITMSIFVVFICISLIGCATLTKKFVRKPKGKEKPKEIFQKTNQVYPADIRYNNYFIYWRTWQGELVLSMGKNNKKVLGCADRALYNLSQMYELLKPKKQKELEPYVDQLQKIVDELHEGDVSTPRQKRIMRALENHIWDVRRGFDYLDMKKDNWIKQD